ncbi:hypothetical protein RRF57_002551 [Xylaria bambusicola]|uniref:Uncharacterized protein n=1 Tax=Xylaria bambusicola TaxID=326684 RepID=A0AAN7UIW8_9PEZI
MAKPMEHLPPRIELAAVTAGVQNPVGCGVRRGVGSKPRAGASRPGVFTVDGTGSIIAGAAMFLGVGVASGASIKGVARARGVTGDELGDSGKDTKTLLDGLIGIKSSRLSRSGSSCRISFFQSKHCSRIAWDPEPGGG